MIRNRNIDRRFHSLFLPAKDFNSVGRPLITSLDLTDGGPPDTIVSQAVTIADQDDDDIVLSEVGTTGFLGLKMGNDGEVIQHLMPLPRNVDFSQPVQARVHWTSGSSTTSDTVTWKVFVKALAYGDDITGTIDTALDTAIAQDTVTGAWDYQVTASGKLNADTIDPNTSDVLLVLVEMDAKAAGLSEDLLLLGLELAYVPLLATDTGSPVYTDVPWS